MVTAFTDKQRRAVLLAVANWHPEGISVALMDIDRQRLREQVTLELAKALEVDGDGALTRMEALRMAGDVVWGRPV